MKCRILVLGTLFVTVALVVASIPALALIGQDRDEPDQTINVIHLNMKNTSANVTLSNSEGVTAEFQGSLSCDSPFMTVKADLSVTSADWDTAPDKATIEFQGRANETFKFLMQIPARIANGTIGSAHAVISVLATGVGRSYASQTEYTLAATVTNSDEVEAQQIGGGGGGAPGTKIPITLYKANSTKKSSGDDPIKKYSNYIIILAVIGIIAGVIIKVMVRMQKHRKRQF